MESVGIPFRVGDGTQVHKYKNLFNRDFQADKPNAKWVTDISYIHTDTGEGVLYLSVIRDLYDTALCLQDCYSADGGSGAGYHTTGQEKVVAGRLQLHSSQDFQYTSQAYFNLTKKYGITPSMSRRGNAMITLWLKISSPSSKPSVSTAKNQVLSAG